MSLWNFTFDDTSTFFTYTPYADGSNSGLTKGWEPWYTQSGFISQNGEGGAGDSYHLTSLAGASVSLDFYGTAVYLYGTTNSTYDILVDNSPYVDVSPIADLLVSVTNLQEGNHNVTLTARPSESSEQLAFDRAVVSAPLINNQTPTEAFYDNSDTATLTYTGDWSVASAPGIPNATISAPWHETLAQGANVAMDIGVGAVGVSLYGMANWGNWLYTVSVDGGAENTYNGSTFWKVPDALLFYQGGLDPTRNHSVKITNVTPQMKLALNSIRVYNTDVAQTTSSYSTSSATAAAASISDSVPSASSAHSSVNAGAVAGAIVGVGVILALIGRFFWWHSRRSHPSPSLDMAESDRYRDGTPHRPAFPSPGYLGASSAVALNSPRDGYSPREGSIYSVPHTEVSGPPGAVVMSWGPGTASDYDEDRSTTVPRSGTLTPNLAGTTSDVLENRRPVGKMQSPPPPPAPAPITLDTPDVDRLIELIAQRIDRGGPGRDESAPPEYHG
ncbi:hypothetical protein DFH07DRAFT_822744 [Mycena maculata]|uniref:Transmembrane protein n=1 Tax=Mycena maculata TaxID=230809 RepID=A0AAD7J4R5_9AGAR|nr:hypothetical protein DFH07DRAFT_822744 [Mycena maculata]